MQLDDYINIYDLTYFIDTKEVSKRLHPKWPLAILNYTQASMGKTHDYRTLRRCRGLIYNYETMEVVSRPMEAFYNLNDERYQETAAVNLPKDATLEITEKMDGSLGIVYQYQDNPPEVATRGSFTSDQALWATEYLQSYPLFRKPSQWTPLVEIIYPDNQVVVDYNGESKLVLFTMVSIPSGSELSYDRMIEFAYHNNMVPPLTIVKRWDKSVAQCAMENEKNREGVVAKFFGTIPNLPPLRIKIKFEDYVLCHRAMFGMNTRDVWELLKDGKEIGPHMFPFAPDGWKGWLQDTINFFIREFSERQTRVLTLVDEVWRRNKDLVGHCYLRKDAAYYFKLHSKDLASACFSCYDGKDYEAVIWKLIRPVKAEGYKGSPEVKE